MEPVLPPEYRKAAIEAVVRVLNEAFAADAAAVHALLCNRVPCNKALADHSTVQVMETPTAGKFPAVGTIGLLNGAMEVLTGERIASVWEPDSVPVGGEVPRNVFAGFRVYDPS